VLVGNLMSQAITMSSFLSDTGIALNVPTESVLLSVRPASGLGAPASTKDDAIIPNVNIMKTPSRQRATKCQLRF